MVSEIWKGPCMLLPISRVSPGFPLRIPAFPGSAKLKMCRRAQEIPCALCPDLTEVCLVLLWKIPVFPSSAELKMVQRAQEIPCALCPDLTEVCSVLPLKIPVFPSSAELKMDCLLCWCIDEWHDPCQCCVLEYRWVTCVGLFVVLMHWWVTWPRKSHVPSVPISQKFVQCCR